MKIYLGSGSPRRKELLTQIGIEYEVKVSEADEKSDITDPAALVEELSKRKAVVVALDVAAEAISDEEEFMVIGADTVVALDGTILGKPKDAEDAKRMLRMLSGKSHSVFTGVTFVKCLDGETAVYSFHEETKVIFEEMSEAEIDEYVTTGDPLDKAGAYGIQGFCARYIKGIEGDYNNVVGLPVGRVYQEMKKF